MTTTDTMSRARAAIADANDQARLDALLARARKLVDDWVLTDGDLEELEQLAAKRSTSFAAAAPAKGDDREIVGEGEQEVEIAHYSYGPVGWKVNPKNPDGLCHRLRLKQGDKRFIFEDLPATLSNVVRDLEGALGCDLGEEVVGKTLRCLVRHIVTKNGETRAVVARWVLPRKQAATAAAATARPSRNATPPGDDVAF